MKIITITLNPAFDIHYNIENLELHKENYAQDVIKQAGGKGINISRALRKFGVDSTAFIALGMESRDEFLKELKQDGVLYKDFCIDGKIRENITLHSGEGETRISVEGFGFIEQIFVELKSAVIKESNEDTVVTFTGRLPKGIEKGAVVDFLKEIKDKGAKLIVDCNSFDKEELFEIKPFLIKPNEQEVAKLFKIADVSHKNAFEIAQKLHAGGVENVIISLGGEGFSYFGEGGAFDVSVPKVDVVSTIGAGDSLIAGFIYGLAQKLTLENTLKYAAAFSVCACTTSGTNPPEKEKTEEILKQIDVEFM